MRVQTRMKCRNEYEELEEVKDEGVWRFFEGFSSNSIITTLQTKLNILKSFNRI